MAKSIRAGGAKLDMYRNLKNIREKQYEFGDKFPHCRGTFDSCPTEEELKIALENKMVLPVCGKCPVFHESKIKGLTIMKEERKMTSEGEEFYREIMKR